MAGEEEVEQEEEEEEEEERDEEEDKVGSYTLGVGQEAVEKRDGCARGDSDGVVLREAVSRGNTWTPREMMESGICEKKAEGGGGLSTSLSYLT